MSLHDMTYEQIKMMMMMTIILGQATEASSKLIEAALSAGARAPR